MLGHGLERIRRTSWVIAAHLAVERADGESPRLNQPDQWVLHLSTRSRQLVRSDRNCAEFAVAARGWARTTTNAPPATCPSDSIVSRLRCLNRRFTRLRTTEFPTPLLTVNPTSTRSSPLSSSTSRWTTNREVPARRPDRTTRRKSWVSASRLAAGSTADARTRGGSDSQALATLAPTRRQDRTAGTRPHAQTEAVHLVATAVVQLISTLAHGIVSVGYSRVSTPRGIWCGLRPAPPTHVASSD